MTGDYPLPKLAPLRLVAFLSLGSLIYFFYAVGWHVITKPYLWPSFLLTPFFSYCAISRCFSPWHRFVWRCAQVWSGFWSLFLVGGWVVYAFFALLYAYLWPSKAGGDIVSFFPFWWCLEMRVNPWLALGLHILVFACCTDILKRRSEVSPTETQIIL